MHLRLALGGLRFRADPMTTVIHYRTQGSMSSGHPIECARAQVDVLARVAERTGRRYREDIGARLWRLAGVCGSFDDWEYVERCMDLADRIGYRQPAHESWFVRTIARFNPSGAVRLRERFIRLVKPRLRAGLPLASSLGGRK
jgi:hypothetical protein